MAANLLGIDRSTGCADCSDCEGGIVRFAVTELCCIQDLTIDAVTGHVTAVTMTALGAGGWAAYVQDSDDTSFLSQVAEKISDRIKRFNVTAFAKFECVDDAMELEVRELCTLCEPVAFIEKSNGSVRVVGVDVTGNATDGFEWKRAKTKLSILVSILTGTGAESDRLEFNFEAVHRLPAAISDVDIDALLLL